MATRPVTKFVHPSYGNPESRGNQDPRINQGSRGGQANRTRSIMPSNPSTKPSGIKLPSSVNGGTRTTPPSQQITPEVLVNLDQMMSSPSLPMIPTLPTLPLPPNSQSSHTSNPVHLNERTHQSSEKGPLYERLIRVLQTHASSHNSSENTLKLPWIHPEAINMVDRLILIQGLPFHLSEEKTCKWVKPRLFDLEPIFESIEVRDSPLVWTQDYLNIRVKLRCSSTVMSSLEELGYRIRYDSATNLYVIETNAIRTGLIVLLLNYILESEFPLSQGLSLKNYFEKELSNEWACYENHRDITKLTLHRMISQLLVTLI